MKGGAKGNPVVINILSGSSNDVTHAHTCLGCKKFYVKKTMADKHIADCENKKAHITMCNELLSACPVAETADSSEAVKALQAKVKQQEREIKNLESELEDTKENSALYKRLIWGLVNGLDRADRRRIAQVLYDLPEHPSLGEIDWDSQLLTEYEVGKNNFTFSPPDEGDD